MQGFQKFKKIQERNAWINSLIWGLAAAMFAASALLLVAKLGEISLHVILYVIVPLLACAAAGSVCYLIYRPKDKKVAKRLDEEFALGDRAQTMIEFQNVHTDMVQLQREDADARLQNLRTSKLKWKGLWFCLVAFIVALTLFIPALAIPKPVPAKGGNEPPRQEEEEPFQITLMQKTQLATLVKNVKESAADSAVKTAIVTELENLQTSLDEIDTETKLYDELVRIIETVDAFVEEYNSYKRIYDVFHSSQSERVQRFAIGIGLNNMPDAFSALKATFENEEAYNVLTLAAITEFVEELNLCFDQLTEAAEDPLTLAIQQLIEDVDGVSKLDPTTYSYDLIIKNVDVAMNDNVKPLADALAQQTLNRTVTNDTIKELIRIFDLPEELIPEWGGKPLEGLGNAGLNPDETQKPGDGIIIDGIQYPSNETVYDYFTKVVCEYGKVFEGDAHNYKSAINQLLSEGVANGTIDSELEEMIRLYLDELSGKEPVTGGEN